MLLVENNGSSLIVSGVQNFDAKQTFESGQCFRWLKESDGSYSGVVDGKVIKVASEGDKIILHNTNAEDFNNFWKDYLDLERDYIKVMKELSDGDEVMEKACKAGEGVRILKQDMWEMIVSYIISARNSIPQIRKTVERLSQKFGNPILMDGNTYYSFPTPEALYNADILEIRECGASFRDKYVKAAAEMVYKNEIDLESIKNMPLLDAMNELMRIPGIGMKVSSCILLYGYQYFDAFPVDVWIKRIMEYFYMDTIKSEKYVYDYAYKKFGKLCGFANIYLFCYAREQKIKAK